MSDADETFTRAASDGPGAKAPDDELTALANGILTNVHGSEQCRGRHCWVHNPSEHHMRRWPVRWTDRATAERMCEHGIGHPDPDDVGYHRRHGRDVSVHGCDGCCASTPPGLTTWRIADETVDQLGPDSTGVWLVTTQGGEHIWDLNARTHLRLPGEGRPRFNNDGTVQRIRRVGRWPRVGAAFLFVYDDSKQPGLEQYRQSSVIRSIERLEASDEQ